MIICFLFLFSVVHDFYSYIYCISLLLLLNDKAIFSSKVDIQA